MNDIAERVHGGTCDGSLDFSANINPLGPPESVINAMTLALKQIDCYPDPDCRALKDAIAAKEGIGKDKVACGNGAAEFFFAAFSALKPRRAVIPVPSFCEYQIAARAAGTEVVLVPPLNDRLDIDILNATMTLDSGDLCVICSPNNPTGQLLPRHEIIHLLRRAVDVGATVIVDEAFIDFIPDSYQQTVIRNLDESLLAKTIVLRSMTKFFAIPGVRLGYALGSPGVMHMLEMSKDPWSVNTFAQAAGVAALGDHAYHRATLSLITEERTWLLQKLHDIEELRIVGEPSANFIMLQLTLPWKMAKHTIDIMHRVYGISVRDCSSYDGLGEDHGRLYIRIAVKDRVSNTYLIQTIKTVLARGDQ